MEDRLLKQLFGDWLLSSRLLELILQKALQPWTIFFLSLSRIAMADFDDDISGRCSAPNLHLFIVVLPHKSFGMYSA